MIEAPLGMVQNRNKIDKIWISRNYQNKFTIPLYSHVLPYS